MAYKRFLLNSKSIPLQAPIGILPQERFLKLLRNRTVQLLITMFKAEI